MTADSAPYEPGPFKACRKCSAIKPLDDFPRANSKLDGHRNECRECKKAAARAYGKANREAIRAKTALWREQNRERSRVGSLRVYQRLREAVFDHYGRCCACCGSAERPQVDHINGDGGAHRKELFGDSAGGGGPSFYRWLIETGFPSGFQTLCERCNRSKGNGEHCLLDHSRLSIAGVSYRPGISSARPWQARIGKRYLGIFATQEEAEAVRREAERLVQGERHAG